MFVYHWQAPMTNPAQHGWRDGKGAWKLCFESAPGNFDACTSFVN